MHSTREASSESPLANGLEARLKDHVETLASRIGERNICCPQALDAAHLYIEDEWCAQGYAVTRQSYNVGGVRCTNLEITRRGQQADGGILLIGAHYDTVPGSPGANDNASGVAALLEISRFLTETEF